MRKSLFFTIVLSLCMMQNVAFSAVQRNARNVNTPQPQSNSESAAVTARAATRNVVKTTNTPVQNEIVSARAGSRQKVVTQNDAPQTIKARAGATQKVINTGTKVATATENTIVPQECQDAFYGCMDSFCMLDNASGGRCQCSDRIIDLDKALEDILKLDEQTYIMATEGVERIQMGEAENQIIARAKAAAEKVTAEDKSADNKKKARNLDLSLWNNNVFSDNDDDFFSALDANSANSMLDKKGDALYSETAKLCAGQIPAKCKSYGSMLQLVYAQKIKSDCIAYENSLKAQKIESQQKLQTAEKALRDAALDEYRNQNKYATTGECVIAFTQCMQTTAECGEDYTGCVTLAAKENVKNNKSGSKAKQTKIKGAVAGADITLAASTMDQLLSKKLICESVTKQCVNANKNDAVWDAFLHNAAPALKSAELIAEQRLRSDCIPSVTECFKNSCKSNFGDGDSYDACLANPDIYKSFCKVELEPCLEATGGTYDNPKASSLWQGLKAALTAMRVDTCTTEIKSCITDICGEDYAVCVGLDADNIVGMCPKEKLTACAVEDVDDYIDIVAQGIKLQISNSLIDACQNAVDTAMVKVCGDTESCKIFANDTFGAEQLSYGICVDGDPTKDCKADASMVTAAYSGTYIPTVSGQIDWGSCITVDSSQTDISTVFGNQPECEDAQIIVDSLNQKLTLALGSIESDTTVMKCKDDGKFKNLTQNIRDIIAQELYNIAKTNYDTKLEELQSKANRDFDALESVYAEKADSAKSLRKAACLALEEPGEFYKLFNSSAYGQTTKSVSAVYDNDNDTCTLITETFKCYKARRGGNKACSMDRKDCNKGVKNQAPGSWCREGSAVSNIVQTQPKQARR